jgi:hypothetical protein
MLVGVCEQRDTIYGHPNQQKTWGKKHAWHERLFQFNKSTLQILKSLQSPEAQTRILESGQGKAQHVK